MSIATSGLKLDALLLEQKLRHRLKSRLRPDHKVCIILPVRLERTRSHCRPKYRLIDSDFGAPKINHPVLRHVKMEAVPVVNPKGDKILTVISVEAPRQEFVSILRPTRYLLPLRSGPIWGCYVVGLLLNRYHKRSK